MCIISDQAADISGKKQTNILIYFIEDAENETTYFEFGEPSKKFPLFCLTIFTKSRLNLNPEKLHSEGKANKL